MIFNTFNMILVAPTTVLVILFALKILLFFEVVEVDSKFGLVHFNFLISFLELLVGL